MKHFIGFICILTVIGCKGEKGKLAESVEEKALRIHKEVITIDTHVDINVANFTDTVNYTQKLDNQVNLPKLKSGDLDVPWLVVYTGQGALNEAGYAEAKENAMAKFEAIHRLCKEIAPEEIGLAYTSQEVHRIVNSGKKVAMIGVENAYPIGNNMSEFENYYNLGARYISLSHNGHSQFCDSNTGEADGVWLHNGLSDLGKKAVQEMNRLGIMIDVSHVSKESMKQMIALSKAPVIASHSSARALCNHSRNLDDEQLLLMKENGGVVQTVAFSAYLNTEKHEAHAAFMPQYYKEIADSLGIDWYVGEKLDNLSEQKKKTFTDNYQKVVGMARDLVTKRKGAPQGVDVSDFVDHVDYMVNLIGIDHVGISSDFDGGGGIVGWTDASETPNVTLELVKRGYSKEQIAQLWGGNLLRVLDQVQEVSKGFALN